MASRRWATAFVWKEEFLSKADCPKGAVFSAVVVLLGW